jgi:hypothetical protein
MGKPTISSTLKKVEARIQRVLDVDGMRLSRPSKLALDGALFNLHEAMEIDRSQQVAPGGLVILRVLMPQDVADDLWALRNRQKGKNGTPISLAETIRRAVSVHSRLLNEADAGNRILAMDPENKAQFELALK